MLRCIVIAFFLLAGCMVGPNYTGPPKVISHDAFERGQEAHDRPLARWWENFNDAQLSALIETALKANPTVKIAEAHVRQARAVLGGSTAELMPDVSGRAAYARVHLPPGFSKMLDTNENVNYYNAGFDATWELDLFGGLKRGVEAATAQEEAAQFRLADTQVQLSAEVAQAYANLRGMQMRVSLQHQIINTEQKMADLIAMRYRHGTATVIDVVHAKQQAAASEADILPIESQIEQELDALSFLTAKEPGDLDHELALSKALLLPPTETKFGNPADLLRNRPDIRAAERTLAMSTAEIGVARAQEFPQVTLLGTLGWGGTRLDDIGKSTTLLAAAAPVLQWHFLDFGRAEAKVEESKAERDAAREAYRGVVLSALRDAEDSLSRYGHQRDSVTQLLQARDLAAKAAEMTHDRYTRGTANLPDYLDAERQRLQAEQSLTQGEVQFSIEYISLEKNLGLGWE